MKVSVCINTYKRHHLLQTLLSIYHCQGDLDVELIVSDNDYEASGFPLVKQFTSLTGVHVNYEVVPEKNIAIARNSAVRRAKGEWIYFIDDDELAEEGLLASALRCAEKYQADAVLGPVRARYDSGAPKWLLKADPFSKFWGVSGKRLSMASTCNLLFKTEWLRRFDGPFNPAYGRSGSDDTELTFRLSKAGAVIVANSDGWVSEEIPLDRSFLPYIEKRFTRSGQCHARIIMAQGSLTEKTSLALNAFIRFSFILLCSPFFILLPRHKWLKFKIVYWKNKGKIDSIFGINKIELY